MPLEESSQTPCNPRKIQRNHSGCRACRRRGKKCDEAKPTCRACTRLRLDCSYGVDYAFCNIDSRSYQKQPINHVQQSQPVSCSNHKELRVVSFSAHSRSGIPLDISNSAVNLETQYLDHFMRHVRHLLPALSISCPSHYLQSAPLRAAAVCISASNLSMLHAQIQSRSPHTNPPYSLFSPRVNTLHHSQARTYHDQALSHCTLSTPATDTESNPATTLTALTLLAYYHHASTSHTHFRHAVWKTFHFVTFHRETLSSTPDGLASLQTWYRLCISHRLSKPPSLLLEGEGKSTFGPNRYPDSLDDIYMQCILGMSADDLIYDIMIKTIEIRNKVVVFRAVAGRSGVNGTERGVGAVAHDLLTRLIGNEDDPDLRGEADRGFVRGEHLLGLLDIQKSRLDVWKSRVSDDNRSEGSTVLPTHRDAINALYSLLCQMMFVECHAATASATRTVPSSSTPLDTLASSLICILSTMNLTMSATSDIYTFSLTEVLLQFTLIYKSATTFSYIFNTIWSQLDARARGYEHSHYPTHLVKRIIGLLAELWDQGRDVSFAVPAFGEGVSKVRLLDVYAPAEVVICGRSVAGEGGKCFVEKIALP
ncbi:hypothetical protein BJX70DRAFT_339092 [Aspergillus crustosus]